MRDEVAEVQRRGMPTGSAATLSSEIQRKVALLFAAEERKEAARMLLALQKDFSEMGEAFGQRVQTAALRVSHGEIERLRKAIEVGLRDFRDLLSAAGFTGGLLTHERWQPTPGKVSGWERLRERFYGIR